MKKWWRHTETFPQGGTGMEKEENNYNISLLLHAIVGTQG